MIARKISKNFCLYNTPAECISPVKLSMQSVAVKSSNKRCIATCLHLSVYEIVTHFLMNFFVSYYFDGNESCSPKRTQQAQNFQGPILTSAKTRHPLVYAHVDTEVMTAFFPQNIELILREEAGAV